MKKLLRKFANWFYLHYGSINIQSMTRMQLGLFNGPVELPNLTPPQQKRFFKTAKDLMRNSVLKQIFDIAVDAYKQNMLMATEDKNIINDQIGRASCRERV